VRIYSLFSLTSLIILPVFDSVADDIFIENSSIVRGQTYNNNDNVIVRNNGQSINNHFTGTARETVFGPSDEGPLAGVSIADIFSGQAVQSVSGEVTVNKGQFSQQSRQELGDGATSAAGYFSDNAVQDIFNGYSKSDVFTGNAIQTVRTDAVSQNATFSGNAFQWLVSSDDTVADFVAARSENSTFNGSSRQLVMDKSQSESDLFEEQSGQLVLDGGVARNASFTGDAQQELESGGSSAGSQFSDSSSQRTGNGAKSASDRFTDIAVQTINSGGSATGATFSGNASQVLNDGAVSENTTFNDSSSGIVSGQAQMTGSTTLNGNALLTVVAQEDNPTQQLAQITVNNGSALMLVPKGAGQHYVNADKLALNGGSVLFGHDERTAYTTLATDELSGKGGSLIMNGDLTGGNDQFVVGTVSGSGIYYIILNNQDYGKDLNQNLTDLIEIDAIEPDSSPDFRLLGFKMDQGTHKVIVDTKKDPVTGKTVVVLVTDTSQTSRTTDAVMGLASATQYIFDGEMQALRTRRGDIQRFDQGEGGVWGRYLHNSTDITAGAGSDYRLGQNGMEIGGDKVFDVAEGKLSVGALTSYSKSSVKQRGDSSPVASYGAGLYSTWMSPAGYYADGVIKYNRFSSDLRTHTDRGQLVKGSYDQNGYGAALETGYQLTLGDGISVDPYVRASYFAAQGKDMALSNGMKADIGTQKSAKGELGVSVGKAFEVRSVTLSPYVTTAVEHEFLKDNTVTFNDRYTYKNDQSGTLGKFGAGMTAQVSKNAQVFVEADYRKGNKVESPIMANAGFRINF